MNELKSSRKQAGPAVKSMELALGILVAVILFGGLTRQPQPAHAFNPIMHNSSSTGSSYWGGGWGNGPNSKYGKFTCTTCHAAGPASGNVKQIKNVITAPANSRGDVFPGSQVVFESSTSYGSDLLSRRNSNRICEVCHTMTKHHRYDNTAGATTHKGDIDCVACHLHRVGFRKQTVEGAGRCGDCHSDLYGSTSVYGMHNPMARMSYKHYLDNDNLTYTTGPAGIPNGTDTNVSSRRCTMCHVDHNVFSVQATATAGRAFNLRDRADGTVTTRGYNDDYTLCLSCHYDRRDKFLETPNGSKEVMPIPFGGLSYNNATSVLTFSTHGYAVKSTFDDPKLGSSSFRGICVKCHNDTIGGNGDIGYKSSEEGQDSTYKFGEHNSTIPNRFAVYGNLFYQRPPDITATTLSYSTGTSATITIAPSPNWVADSFLGHTVTVTGGTGSNQRMRITTNTANTLTLSQPFAVSLDNTSLFDVSDDNISVDDVCFSCHSQGGQGKFLSYTGKDWYGTQRMKKPLEGIMNLFVGDSGSITSTFRGTSVTLTTRNYWAAGALVGYKFKAPGGTRTITGQSAASTGTGPYSTTISWAARLTSGSGPWEIIKPSSHPLDTYSRHDSYERVSPGPGWNMGDSGVSTSSSGAGSVSDTGKTWSGAEFTGMTIWFPGGFDGSGNPAKSLITGGGQGVINFTPIAGFTPDTAGGDNYFIGNDKGSGRHTACADCHNTHSTFNNPEGTVTSATLTTLVASDSVNRSGWRDNIWTGYLIKVVSSTHYEQIRYITGFNQATGEYTVSIPWSSIPNDTYTYEVLMGERWTGSQGGGRAGSGSSGTWGIIPDGWRPVPAYGNMTGPTGVRKIENVFDNVSSTGLRGSPNAGQRDLCVKCHSSFAFGTATPMNPSGGPAPNSTARATDVMEEFNPNNPAHHAVYARGKNQPITPTGDVAGARSAYNPYWPAYGSAATGAPYSKATLGAGNDTTKTVTLSSSGVASFAGGSIPGTVKPGWFLYVNAVAGGTAPAGTALAQGATKGWFEVVSVDSPTQVTVTPKPSASYAASYFKLTAGLGNNFVPPYGTWSILRCTDCHGSTRTDPVGPHASVNRWLIKSLDTDLSFEWYDGSSVVTITPNTGAVTAIFCFNCHRRDVYGDANNYTDSSALATNKIAYRSFSRQAHSGGSGRNHPDGLTLTGMFNDDSRIVSTNTLIWGDISCRHCHVGDKVGGIHGTNAKATNASAPNNGKSQGKRFLNGASWIGYGMPTTTAPTCYTAPTNSVSTCNRTSYNTATSAPLYNYTGAR